MHTVCNRHRGETIILLAISLTRYMLNIDNPSVICLRKERMN